ncbi:xylulokinase [Silvimonas iriomotensis]|uniref:Xylulose kinase n=1 Tax=Silvimonas iriomotensis TaxID=449662 RepID=A0ABQ2PDE6_9NEIS|nr:xylulokinase [Silvimonas iriomotensis]GGP23281.1 xylulokinase [Silvimonas iriomotensis]
MFIGIDLGTSSLKAIVLDRAGTVRASASAPLTVSRPQPLWSEQSPADWWAACETAIPAVLALAAKEGIVASDIEAIGLTGQMHGATLLDAAGQVLRPAMLWNDGRAFAQCAALEKRVPQSRQITGNLMMPGFTAPKLLWVAEHEPDVFKQVATVLLPKDYLRYCLSGNFATDLSDAAGTLWLDVGKRDWSDEILAATGLTRAHMPQLFEGNQITGQLKPELAARWGLRSVPVVAGASDNAAGAIGAGIVAPGQAMLSLGTSGVYFAASDGFRANPQRAVHSFCHALPGTWHLMSVMLSAASCLDFTAQLTGYADVPAMLQAAEGRGLDARTPLFLPYLTGERTPHNNPAAQGAFFGLTAATTPADMANATLEGVAFGLADGVDALEATGVVPEEVTVIGGGSRSGYWVQMLADVLGRELVCREGGEVGPALGAARLAHLAIDPAADIAQVCPVPPVTGRFTPDAKRTTWLSPRRARFATLYRAVEPLF